MICFDVIIVSRFGIAIGSDVVTIAHRETEELSFTPGSILIDGLVVFAFVENEQDDDAGVGSLEYDPTGDGISCLISGCCGCCSSQFFKFV